MPNIRSAKKRVKVSATKTATNKARKSNLKTMIKKADAAQACRSGLCKGSDAQECSCS